MKLLLLSPFLVLAAAWLSRAQSPSEQDEAPRYELRLGAAEVDALGRGDKICAVKFPEPMKSVPTVTATVASKRPEDEFQGVFAVTLLDVTREGFRYVVQEADSKLRWSSGLELNWIALAPER